jgi:hypothetical protein
MEFVGYSGHVLSSLTRGTSRGLEKGRRSRSKPSVQPDLEPPGPSHGHVGSFKKNSATENPGPGPSHGPIGAALSEL